MLTEQKKDLRTSALLPSRAALLRTKNKSETIAFEESRHRQVTDLDVTVLGFSGPGLPFPR